MERSIKSVTSDQRPRDENDWNIHGYIEVPNSLDRCTQDCDASFIRVKHRHVTFYILANCSVKFVIGLRNPDGHVSEIRASLPCALVLPSCISSTGTTPHLDDSTVNHLSNLDSGDVLPSYESRIYDRLWDGVSYGGLDISALNTPITMSRPTSAENLRELNRITMPNPEDLEAGLHRALRERNAEGPESIHNTSSENLNVFASTSGSMTSTQSAPITGPPNSEQSTDITRTTPLNEDDQRVRLTRTSSPEMQHISPTTSNGSPNGSSYSVVTSTSEDYIDMRRLSCVPSYSAANSSVLNLDPITNALPTYALATSNLPVISEQPGLQATSTTPRRLTNHSSEARVQGPPPTARPVSTGDTASGFRIVGRIGSVYGAPHDPMRRFSMMRSLFASH